MFNVLVTGGAGFIGHHLADRLSQTRCKIIIVDNLTNPNTKFLHSIKSALKNSNASAGNFITLTEFENDVSVYVEDIRNKEALMDIFKYEEIDTCIHLTAKSRCPRINYGSWRHYRCKHQRNIKCPRSLLKCGGRKFCFCVFFSSLRRTKNIAHI